MLSVHPFKVLFVIPVEGARFAGFTPDSQELVFISPPGEKLVVGYGPFLGAAAHVERWRVADGSRTGFARIPLWECESAGLSPDGRVLVCLDRQSTLRIVDVASWKPVVELKKFVKPNLKFGVVEPGNALIDFSPDSHFLLVRTVTRTAAWDLRQMTEVQLPGVLKRMEFNGLAFVAPDTVLVTGRRGKNGVAAGSLREFPSGKLRSKTKVPDSPPYTAADPRFVVVRPFGRDRGAAAANLATAEVIISNTPALDIFGHCYVAEHTPDQVGLYEIGKGLQATATIPARP